jgi:hypothetical protein
MAIFNSFFYVYQRVIINQLDVDMPNHWGKKPSNMEVSPAILLGFKHQALKCLSSDTFGETMGWNGGTLFKPTNPCIYIYIHIYTYIYTHTMHIGIGQNWVHLKNSIGWRLKIFWLNLWFHR